MLSVDFKNEAHHWRTFVRLVRHRQFGSEFVYGIVIGVAAIGGAVQWTRCEACGFDESSLAVGAIWGLIVVFFAQVILNRFWFGNLAKSVALMGDRKLTLTQAGLELVGPSFRSVMDWAAIEETTTDEKLLVLWLDKTSGIYVPTSAFASKADEVAFREFVIRHIVPKS